MTPEAGYSAMIILETPQQRPLGEGRRSVVPPRPTWAQCLTAHPACSGTPGMALPPQSPRAHAGDPQPAVPLSVSGLPLSSAPGWEASEQMWL